MSDYICRKAAERERELTAKTEAAVFGLKQAFEMMPATVETQLKISKLNVRFPEVFQPFLSFMESAAQAAICSSHTSSSCSVCASNSSNTADLIPNDRASSSDNKISSSLCSAAMSSRGANDVSPSISSLSPKLFAVDSEILDRFQDRVSRIEFVRSAGPAEQRTILHITPKLDVPDA